MSVDSLMEKQTPQQAEAIFTKLEAFEINFLDEPPAKKRQTKLRKNNLIFNYVKHNCHCVAFSFYKWKLFFYSLEKDNKKTFDV